MNDKVFKIVITGFVIQKDYMGRPDEWDWSDIKYRWEDFLDTPDIEVTELIEAPIVKD